MRETALSDCAEPLEVVAQRTPLLPLCGGSSLLDAGGEARGSAFDERRLRSLGESPHEPALPHTPALRFLVASGHLRCAPILST
jgi:hypothetical protein